uniref:Uncharacterized protein n=1 Tax=Haptolina ericina TaxID=156174 RepID=A0A7S3B3L8_9EUKA|mmetsp:Transcript_50105/g.112617  ORF Transcript_50105/g.112617 Transcript_50105/m.112617 type:complete len:274 (+) Transcript_50105:350-1171(+)|eukprot:CAMPEP_0181218924 /NCGR_PEP_ID=MMETSP1096-20121128/27970_1 /TAXON_ID=156174 ORGANISM="Chrysochromulina ericina, Strain CCMP281" /NCGR_SAMPLE_ID=MMETSP1096 /ASSEMBLY_ACC=CAM_ASM_000453 /LENGTH=273 /DNA_ID=CAMNT_0023311207 /DNA_START=246 /DNA_END=1067 /DNA_ORIENTATION=+
MQPMPNLLRQWLYRGLLHDIDFVNAHPTIMLGLVKLHRPDTWQRDTPRLAEYVTDPNAFRRKIVLHYRLPSLDLAKSAILVAINGGTIQYWRNKVKSPLSRHEPDLPALFELQREALYVRNTIVFKESAIKEAVVPLKSRLLKLTRNASKSEEELDRSVFSYVLGHYESMALEEACKVLNRHGFMPTSLIYDGCLTTDSPDGNIELALREAEVEVTKVLGFDGLKLKEKDMFHMNDFSIGHHSREMARQAALNAVFEGADTTTGGQAARAGGA